MEGDTQVDQKNLIVAINYKNFVNSLIRLLNALQMKAKEFINDENSVRYNKFIKSCDDLIKGFTIDDSLNRGKIVKKIYKTITHHLDKFYPASDELFTMTDNNNQRITIIPGIDINLILNKITNKNEFWSHMYMMYISSASMISANNSKKNEKVNETIPKIKKQIQEYGIINNDEVMNPFIGLEITDETCSMNDMFANLENFKKPEQGESEEKMLESVLKMTGIDKMIDLKKLNEQLKNIEQEDIDMATDKVSELLGGKNDSDVRDVCGTLIEGIVNDIRSNPNMKIGDLLSVAKTVSERVGNTIDQKKMRKTATQMMSMIQKGEEQFKNLKDEKGNPVGQQLFNAMSLVMPNGFQNGVPNKKTSKKQKN